MKLRYCFGKDYATIVTGLGKPPHVLLKARPVPGQLADRLAAPTPPGMELYLDLQDIEDSRAVERTLDNIRGLELDDNFIWLVEGPVRSLDGEFFDVTRDADADRELIHLLGEVSAQIGASTINIHAIAPRPMDFDCSELERNRALERSVPIIQLFESQCVSRGIRPTIENMPPVLRMRQGGFFVSPIGLSAEDLLRMVRHAPEVRICLDYSHAQLYINASAMAERGNGLEEFPELAAMLRRTPSPGSVTAYRQTLGEALLACHVSNATGLLGEGAPYDEGDVDFNSEIPSASSQVTYFVTETLEPDQEHATLMRLAQERLNQSVRRGPA
ncbi:MAG TPA: TIM barrel protein [Chloroflexota bacterium]|nr:TIM barrel protein [Chloroflexota bacterium]